MRRKPAALGSSVKPRFLIHLDRCEYASSHLSMCQYFSFFFLLQVLLQELSSFVFATKMKMTEKGSMDPLRSVMKLCAQSSSRNEKVKLFYCCAHLGGDLLYKLTQRVGWIVSMIQLYHFLDSLPAVLHLFYGPVGSVFFLPCTGQSFPHLLSFVCSAPAGQSPQWSGWYHQTPCEWATGWSDWTTSVESLDHCSPALLSSQAVFLGKLLSRMTMIVWRKTGTCPEHNKVKRLICSMRGLTSIVDPANLVGPLGRKWTTATACVVQVFRIYFYFSKFSANLLEWSPIIIFSSCRCQKSVVRGFGPTGPAFPGSFGLPVWMWFSPAHPKFAFQTTGGAAEAVASVEAGGLQQSSASQHGGCHLCEGSAIVARKQLLNTLLCMSFF